MKRRIATFTFVAMVGGMLTVVLPAISASAVSGAAFTTTNTNVDGTGHCQNGNEAVNCNIYDGKKFVWLTGGPGPSALADGTYYFAVLVPGGQGGHENPNDGTPKNLSDVSPTSGTGAGDTWTNREFTIANGVISYTGNGTEAPHEFDSNKIRLMPYDDTTNPGGVYILAICSTATADPEGTNPPNVDPSQCKYDAFKVNTGGGGPASNIAIVKDASGAYTNTTTWALGKDVDQTTVTQSSGDVTLNYTVTVTKTGSVASDITVTGTITVFNFNVDANNDVIPVAFTTVSDQLSGGTTCDVTGSGPGTLATLATDFPYSCNLLNLPQGELDNTATISWGDQDLSNGHLAAGSAPFTFSNILFDVTPVNDCVNVTDDVVGVALTPSQFCDSGTATGSRTVHVGDLTAGTCNTIDNTATITETGQQSNDAQTQICVPVDLHVTKNATPGFTRTFKWKIAKSATPTLIEQLGGGTANVTYYVTVTQDGHTDSGWQATGTITVSNPNDFEDITGVNITDAVDNGGTCVVTTGTNVTVPKSGSVQRSYSCSYPSSGPTSNSGTNTATAEWTQSAFSTPSGQATGAKAFQFDDATSGNPTEVNKCVTITDAFNGGSGAQIGTDCVGADPVTKTISYTRTVTVPVSNCVTYDNTATIVETSQSASASVEACGPAKTGALTMGFWQNKNGQSIITKGGSTGGVCNSATWLRQYAPFQDLSATATCAQVATYVTNVIKAATCTSTTKTCNSMLKAQMLATALDVYFSDPALGGNKISAAAPIGGVSIDLTKICHMIDGSTSSTCSGSFETVSSAFGGATSLTVSQMLVYAASQSNVGGTTWYGQVKATQVLAKDGFDAINNQVAFSP